MIRLFESSTETFLLMETLVKPLANKTMKKTTEITAKDVLHWQGEGFSREEPPINELAQIIADIANGDYAIELLKQDIGEQQSSY